GHLLDAGNAVGGPELDQHDLAFEIGGGEFFAGQCREGHLGRGRRGGGNLPCPCAEQRCSDDGARDNLLFHWIGMISTSPAAGAVLLVPEPVALDGAGGGA